MEHTPKTINEELSKYHWTHPEVSFIMTQFRILLEEENLKEQYKFLNLYCNWTLHTEITKSFIGYEILLSISDSIIRHNKKPNHGKWISDAIIEGISLHKVLSEILEIGQQYSIPNINKFNNIIIWTTFATTLVELIFERPVKFPSPQTKHSKKAFETMREQSQKAKDPTAIITELRFYGIQEMQHKYCFEIQCESGFSIHGNFSFITQEMVDHYPS